jgi:hypothetical protein
MDKDKIYYNSIIDKVKIYFNSIMDKDKIYLGDSVYAELDDGMIKLTTNNGFPDDPRNIIYMEENIFNNLVNWVKKLQNYDHTI